MGTLLNRRRYMGLSLPPAPETRVVAIVNATSATSNTTILYNGTQSQFSSIEIDGVVKSSVDYRYVLGSVGNHTVKFTLIDNTTIANNTFKTVASIKSVSIPDSVTSIGSSVFESASALESIVIGKGVESFGQNAIRNNKSLTSIVVDSENTTLDSRDNCNAIILTAQNKLMYGCNTSTIPQGITSLNDRSFHQSGITSIVIPSTVTSIGQYAFYQSYISIITVEATAPPSVGSATFSGCTISAIYVPSESVAAYKAANIWKNYASVIQAIPT